MKTRQKMKKLFVVIPAYNEEKRIGDVIKKTKKYTSNIIVVDDGSRDRTYDVARKFNVIVARHVINLGKGAALKTGCELAIRKGADAMVLIDSDGQHNPEQIPNFIKGLEDSEIVFGCRKLSKNMPFTMRFGNWFIRIMTRLLFGIKLDDTQCGFRALTSNAYRKIEWDSADYAVESEMIANAGKKNLKLKQIPIETIYADNYKGTTVLDGLKIVSNMIWWRVTRWK